MKERGRERKTDRKKERQKERKTLTQSFLSHVDDDAYVGFQLKLDQALVQSGDKNIRYLFKKKTVKTFKE